MIRSQTRQRGLAVLLVVGLASVAVPPAEAAHSYELPNFFTWNRHDLQVLVIPPTHGPLLGDGAEPLPYGIEAAGPYGMYVEMTLLAIDGWLYARDEFIADNPSYSWLAAVSLEVRVLGRDAVDLGYVQASDIVVGYPEHATLIAGVAVSRSTLTADKCLALDTLWRLAFSYNHWDMYKLAGHEFGHCLGVNHPSGPPQDIMSQGGYPNDSFRCPSNLDIKGVANAFAGHFGKPGGGQTASISVGEYVQYCP